MNFHYLLRGGRKSSEQGQRLRGQRRQERRTGRVERGHCAEYIRLNGKNWGEIEWQVHEQISFHFMTLSVGNAIFCLKGKACSRCWPGNRDGEAQLESHWTTSPSGAVLT